MEYKGYGVYDGRPDAINIASDALYVFDYLTTELKISNK